MNKTISRYEHDTEMMKFSLYDEEDERILYVSLDHQLDCSEEFDIELITVNQTMEDFIDSKIINIQYYNFTYKREKTQQEYCNVFYDTFDDDDSSEFNDKYANFVSYSSTFCDSSYIISVKTTQGSFMLLVYNCHNGYYFHDVNIEYDDVNILDSI
jgi:hypothetical protein